MSKTVIPICNIYPRVIILRRKHSKDHVSRMRDILIHFGRMSSLRDPLAPLWKREGFQMTPMQVHMFMWLGIDGSLPMGELAARVRTTLPNCTRTIDKLIKTGLVQRQRAAGDRRSVLARLSPKGVRLYERLDTIGKQRMGQFLALLEEDDCNVLLDILERVLLRASSRGFWAKES